MKNAIYKSYNELPLFLNAETVAKLLGVSPSTGYEFSTLEERKLITTKHTTVTLGTKRNGTLKYYIRPIREALALFYLVR